MHNKDLPKYKKSHSNEAKILELIIKQKDISRSQLSKLTKLKKSSITNITKTLIDKKIIFEGSFGSASVVGGRKPIFLNFNYYCATVIALDIGNTHIKGIISYLNGEILETLEVLDLKIDIIDQTLINMINQLMKFDTSYYGVVGIGISIKGAIVKNKVLFTPYSDIDKIDLSNILEKSFSIPITIINEANASALCEFAFYTHYDSLVNINIGDGIGAGIIYEGILFSGENGTAGEIGHMILFPNGKSCPCGNKGCLEQYASTRVLLKELSDFKHLNTDIISLLNLKHPIINQIINQKIEYLSIAINNLISLFDPKVIIINSLIFNNYPQYLDQLKDLINNNRFKKNIIIKNSSNIQNIRLLGCVAQVTKDFLGVSVYKPGLIITQNKSSQV